MDFLTLTPALLLPWLLGMVVVLATRNPIYTLDDPGELAWIAGTGYLAGAILATLWMRALSLAAIPFGRMSIAMPLLAISVAGSIFVWYRRGGASLALACRRALAPPPTWVSPGSCGGRRVRGSRCVSCFSVSKCRGSRFFHGKHGSPGPPRRASGSSLVT
jgi:hypothetical protein